MRTLEKLSENCTLTVLNHKQMFAFRGGYVDDTSGKSKFTYENGEVCNVSTVDTYNECGELISKCRTFTCE